MKRVPSNLLRLFAVVLLAGLLVPACRGEEDVPQKVRVAYFANLTHVQPLVGLQQGEFQKELGSVAVDPIVFNAGPPLIEALFAGDVDIGYVGPNPAVNGYRQSNGEALRIIAGAVSGGAAFVVRGDLDIPGPAALKGKRLASPQIGNTQDVALRYYLRDQGLRTTDEGGDVEVVNVRNSDILTLFSRKEIAGAWVPEPWASRLVHEAGGRVFLDERALWPEGVFPTTIVVARKEFLDKHPDLVDRWLQAHVRVTAWVNDHPAEAKRLVGDELARMTGAALSDAVLDQAFSNIQVVDGPMEAAVKAGAEHAFALGYLGDKPPDLIALVDAVPLKRIQG